MPPRALVSGHQFDTGAAVLVIHNERPVELEFVRLGALTLHDDVVPGWRPNGTQHAQFFVQENRTGVFPVSVHQPEVILSFAVGNERYRLSIG